jgi:hypothetical protein
LVFWPPVAFFAGDLWAPKMRANIGAGARAPAMKARKPGLAAELTS